MENNEYKTDRLAIAEKQHALAVENFHNIEVICDLSPISFLKKSLTLKKIRDRKTEPNFKFLFAVLWSRVCTLGGIKNEIDPFMVEDINRMIFSMYSDLTIEEIYKAFELERHGMYEQKTDHFQLFSAEYVSNILKKYKHWKSTTRMQHNISADQPKVEENSFSDQQKKEIMDNAIVRSFDEFLVNSEISIPCVHIFDELYERKMFVPVPNYQKTYSIAKFQLERELKSEKSANRQERIKIKEILDNLESENNGNVLSRAKMLVLKDYFSYLKTNNTHIREFIHKTP
jgi:hypothetical protein